MRAHRGRAKKVNASLAVHTSHPCAHRENLELQRDERGGHHEPEQSVRVGDDRCIYDERQRIHVRAVMLRRRAPTTARGSALIPRSGPPPSGVALATFHTMAPESSV